MIRHFLLYAFLLVVLHGCSKKPREGVAVIVNGYEITKPEILQAAEMLRDNMIAAYPEKAVEGVTNELLAGAAQQLIANHLLTEEATAKGITAESTAVDSVYNLLRNRLPDKATFERELIKMGETDSSFRLKIEDGIRLESLMGKILAGIRQIDSQECRTFYEKNKDVYKGSGRIRVSQIFFPFTDSMNDDGKRKVTEKATGVYQQILAGKNFAECAKKYSTGPGTSEGGDLGWFNKGDLRSDLEKPVLPLKKGEYSPVVTTDIGVHLLQKTDEESEAVQPFEAVEKRVRFLLELKERNSLVTRHIDSLISCAKIHYVDTTLAKKPGIDGMGAMPNFGN
jgi:parvulin-like peptidyl-prolyl isomerase